VHLRECQPWLSGKCSAKQQEVKQGIFVSLREPLPDTGIVLRNPLRPGRANLVLALSL
jgi:hypothetical protein